MLSHFIVVHWGQLQALLSVRDSRSQIIMANTETLLSSDEKQLAKQYAKRKAFLFAYVLSTVAFLTVYGLESGHPLFLVDDYAKTILPIAALILIGLTW